MAAPNQPPPSWDELNWRLQALLRHLEAPYRVGEIEPLHAECSRFRLVLPRWTVRRARQAARLDAPERKPMVG